MKNVFLSFIPKAKHSVQQSELPNISSAVKGIYLFVFPYPTVYCNVYVQCTATSVPACRL